MRKSSAEMRIIMQKKISLFSAISTGVGMIIATSCFIPLATGASTVGISFIFAIVGVCLVNMMAAAAVAELNALMPNLTGGLAQYMLAGVGPMITIVTMIGGYVISNIFAAPAEGAMFANVMCEFTGGNIPPAVYSVALTIVLVLINLRGINMSAIVQTVVATFMVVSLFILGFIGMFGLGIGQVVEQEAVLSTDISDIMPLTVTAFWLFIGSEFIVPIGKDMKNPKRNVPLSMFLSLAIMCVIQVMMVIGFKNYTVWEEVGAADSPHILYAVNMLGNIGRYWIIIVAILAAVSTQNSIICCVSEICCGMAKINLLPALFQKKNKKGAPYIVLLLMGICTIVIEATGISSGNEVAFLILCSSLFWMLAYIVYHINVMVLRKKMKNAPRSFKVPLFPLFQVIGIVVTIYMMCNISTNVTERNQIFLISFIFMIAMIVYAFFWCKKRLQMPLLRNVSIPKIMAMESPMYHVVQQEIKEKNSINNK